MLLALVMSLLVIFVYHINCNPSLMTRQITVYNINYTSVSIQSHHSVINYYLSQFLSIRNIIHDWSLPSALVTIH